MLDDGTLLSGGGSEVRAWNSEDNFRLVKERTVTLHLNRLRDISDSLSSSSLICGRRDLGEYFELQSLSFTIESQSVVKLRIIDYDEDDDR